MSLANSLLGLFQVAKRPGVVEWLEREISIPRKMAPKAPGLVNLDTRPFARWILECWNPANGINLCAVSGAAQFFKTTTLVLGMAYRMRWEPVPMIVVGPSANWCKREISERRLHPLINENPALASEKPVDLDQFRFMHMAMKGGDIVLAGANSDTELAGGTFGIAIVEEAAKITHTSGEESPESHPILLTFERTNEYGPSAFKWLSSTPNSPDHLFWQHVERGDFTHPALMCPHCREWFNMELTDDQKTGYRSLVWSKDARNADGVWNKEKVIETAHYICPKNGCVIEDKHRGAMLKGMEEDRKNPAAAKNERSFRVNFMHDPRLRFGDIASTFLDMTGDLFGMQNFLNSKMATTWQEFEANIKEENVSALKNGSYRRGVIPHRPAYVQIMADPGERQTHWEVQAVMKDGSLWVIDWGTVLHWTNCLAADWVAARSYPLANSTEKLHPVIGLIDSGDWTHEVYKFCRASRQTGITWFPTKGSNSQHGTWAETTPPEDDRLKLYTYVDHTAKNDLYLSRIAMRGSPGLHFPADADAELIGGHAGQQLIKTSTGRHWKKIPWDHYGDCTKLGVVGSWVMHSLLSELRAG
jgi:phage terminase large subunit GpA-like protein